MTLLRHSWIKLSNGTQQQNAAPNHKCSTNGIAEPVSDRNGLLQQDNHRDTAYPIQVHDAPEEQKPHQEPTTANAIGAMLDPHAKGATLSIAPPGHDEVYR